jgi:hypothetical protein
MGAVPVDKLAIAKRLLEMRRDSANNTHIWTVSASDFSLRHDCQLNALGRLIDSDLGSFLATVSAGVADGDAATVGADLCAGAEPIIYHGLVLGLDEDPPCGNREQQAQDQGRRYQGSTWRAGVCSLHVQMVARPQRGMFGRSRGAEPASARSQT